MFLELFLVLGAAAALGVYQYKVGVERAERMMKEILKDMELEDKKEEENSNN